ncbi:MAG: biotin transporter BioY, partial [Candidatus Zixiibacteriota bacterium]
SAMVAGTALIFACGLVQLSFFVPDGSLLTLGLNPFVPGAVIKISIATLLLAPISRRVGRMRK